MTETLVQEEERLMAAAMKTIPKGQHLDTPERTLLSFELERRYNAGASIRDLSKETGRSYGAIHRYLTDLGVQLRGRGGSNRKPATKKAAKAAKRS